MSGQFYTPSLGDEVLDLTDCEPNEVHIGVEALPQQVIQNKVRSGVTNFAYSTEVNSPAPITMAARKQIPNTGYTEFFREKAIVIKKENPEINYTELSQIVKNLWQSLSAEEKTHYNEAQGSFAVTHMQKDNSAVILIQSEEESSPTVAEEIFGGDKQLPTQLPNTTVAAPVEQKNEMQNVDETAEQMLNEASGARKCTRENCNKRAIINPDWEDEYCSNECVILHCRSVFSSWVDVTKLQKKTQQT